MPGPKPSPPTYQRRAGRNGVVYARTRLFGREVSLGIADTLESHERLAEVQAQWRAAMAGGHTSAPIAPQTVTVADLAAAFLQHAETHYRHPDGTPTSELASYNYSLAPLLALHAGLVAGKLSPADLKAVRAAMVSGSWLSPEERAWREKAGHPLTVCRRSANQRVARIVRVWRWGVAEGLVPVATWQALTAVKGLQEGRCNAVDHPERGPVPLADVKATLPLLSPTYAAMVQLQLATGMRPGEVCAMRRADIDRQGMDVDGVRVWVWRPASHKTRHHGILKQVPLGPKAQAVLTPFLDRKEAGEYVFSPAVMAEARRAERREKRKTPVQPSQVDRRKADPQRRPGERFAETTYCHAVLRAAEAAGVARWSPVQLRKAAATAVEEAVDLDSARAALGHTTSRTTKLFYARGDLAKAAKVAAKMG